MRRKLNYLVVCSIIGILLLMSFSTSVLAEEKEVVVAQGVDATTMIPCMESITSTSNILENMYDTLVWRDRDLNLIPALATDWENVDELTWDFYLRDDVYWHDGEKFTAHDVKYTIDRILDPEVGSQFAPYHSMVEKVEVLDDYKVRFITKEPHPLLLARLSMTQILAEHYMNEHSEEYLASHPMGTGPFKFVKWDRDERIVMEKNPDHWRGEPEIDRLVFRPIPEPSTRIAELVTGNVDVINNVPPHQLSTVNDSDNARISSVPSLRVIYLTINTLKEGPLQHKKVRQALNYAVNKEGIIAAILEGLGTPLKSGGLSNYHFGFQEDVGPYPYDPEKAKELLAEAGYPDGFEISMMIPDGRYMMDREIGEAIVGMYEEIGIDVSYDIMEWGVYWSHLAERDVADVFLLGWGGATVDAEGTVGPLLYSGTPLSFFSNEKADELIDKGRTRVDEEKRLEAYAELTRLLREEAPWVYLHQQEDLYGVSNHVNWEARADERLWMYPVNFVD